ANSGPQPRAGHRPGGQAHKTFAFPRFLRGDPAMRRLDQLLANLGYCSRREARAWIDAGRVTVRGAIADDPGAKADPADVRVDGEPPDHPDGLLLLLHKPVGLVCSHDAREGPNVYD